VEFVTDQLRYYAATPISATVNLVKESVVAYLKNLKTLSRLPTSKKYAKLKVDEYPFDEQLLAASPLYRTSRQHYRELGGKFNARAISTMRGLSAQDLFADEIDYSPTYSEMIWFRDHADEVSDLGDEAFAISHFSEISLFHEQNHRTIWRLLPPAPKEERDLSRYLNFAESLVVTLDLELGDQLGKKVAPVFEELKIIYRTNGKIATEKLSKTRRRQYLSALMCATYYVLELVNKEDVLKAVDYVLPGQKAFNKEAVRRAHEISELFTRVTNPLWQQRYLKDASKKLATIHAKKNADPLYLPEDPLDLEEEFAIANRVFDYFNI
jgi:hypothetical protein